MSTIPRYSITPAIIVMLAAGCGTSSSNEDASDEAADTLDDDHLDVPAEAADSPADIAEEPLACSPRLFILVDSSASMIDGSTTRWVTVRDALDGFLSSTSASGIEFGLGHFPTDDNCAVDGLVVHPLPEATQTNVATYFAATPEGNTPLVEALEFLTTDTTANLYEDGYHNALVIITDGWECCIIDCLARCEGSTDMMTCVTECQAEIETEAPIRLAAAATTLRDTHGVRTFVIGISDEVLDPQLSAIAENGGTADGEWVSTSSVLGLENALANVAAELKDCLPIEP